MDRRYGKGHMPPREFCVGIALTMHISEMLRWRVYEHASQSSTQ